MLYWILGSQGGTIRILMQCSLQALRVTREFAHLALRIVGASTKLPTVPGIPTSPCGRRPSICLYPTARLPYEQRFYLCAPAGLCNEKLSSQQFRPFFSPSWPLRLRRGGNHEALRPLPRVLLLSPGRKDGRAMGDRQWQWRRRDRGKICICAVHISFEL